MTNPTGHTTPGQHPTGHRPAPPARRILLHTSYPLGYIAPLVSALRDLHTPRATLVLPADSNLLEDYSARWWLAADGRTERTADVVAAVAGCDAAVVGVRDRDGGPVEVLVACEDLGVPACAVVQGRYPFRPGSEQWRGVHPVQVAARAAARAERVRRRAG